MTSSEFASMVMRCCLPTHGPSRLTAWNRGAVVQRRAAAVVAHPPLREPRLARRRKETVLVCRHEPIRPPTEYQASNCHRSKTTASIRVDKDANSVRTASFVVRLEGRRRVAGCCTTASTWCGPSPALNGDG